MRQAPNCKVEKHRVRHGPFGTFGCTDGNNGLFVVPSGDVVLTVIASDGMGWDHVSVGLDRRCPTWEEMDAIKRLFFRDDEWAVQYHPADAECINNHPFCLHLWRPQGIEIPKPLPEMVGIRTT